jgi:hypothetical protein
MSRQINFYAAPEDTERMHQWLLSEFPGLSLVSQRKGPREHTVPVDASEPKAFWRYPVSLLVPAWAKQLLHVEDLSPEFPGQYIVSCRTSPVIEYQPCHWDEAERIATSSRFFWAYPGELPDEAARQIDKLFRWVQRNTVTAQGKTFRFFPTAANTARSVRQNLTGSLRPNPLLQAPEQKLASQ